jgi:hypothetical protein
MNLCRYIFLPVTVENADSSGIKKPMASFFKSGKLHSSTVAAFATHAQYTS